MGAGGGAVARGRAGPGDSVNASGGREAQRRAGGRAGGGPGPAGRREDAHAGTSG